MVWRAILVISCWIFHRALRVTGQGLVCGALVCAHGVALAQTAIDSDGVEPPIDVETWTSRIEVDESEVITWTVVATDVGRVRVYAGKVESNSGLQMAFAGSPANHRVITTTWSDDATIMGRPFAIWSDGQCSYLEWPADAEGVMDVPVTDNLRWLPRPAVARRLQVLLASDHPSIDEIRVLLVPLVGAFRQVPGMLEPSEVLPVHVKQIEAAMDESLAESLSDRFRQTSQELSEIDRIVGVEFAGLMKDPA